MYQRLKNCVSAFLILFHRLPLLPSVAKRSTSSPRQNYWALFFQTILNGTATTITFARKPRSVCMFCAYLREMFYLHISWSQPIVHIFDQLWNMLVRCGIMAFLRNWVIKSKKIQKRALKIISLELQYLCSIFA
jgi:hypothetical protein